MIISSYKKYVKYALFVSISLIFVLSLCILGSCRGTRGSGDTIKAQDLTGVNFDFEQPVKKVFCANSPCQNIVVALSGGEKHIVALLENDRNDNLYKAIFDNYDEIPQIGKLDFKTYDKDILIESGAELVILPERDVSYAAQFEHAGLRTFVVLPNKENRQTITNAVNMLSTLFNEEGRAQIINSEFHSLINKIEERVKNSSSQPKVLFMGNDLNTACTNDLVQSQIIECAGAKNAVSGKYKVGKYADIDENKIKEFNPEVIYIPHYAKYSAEDILNNPNLSGVDAIKDKNVFTFPGHLEPWDVPTPSLCLGICWAAHNLHPQAYTQEELMQDVNSFYKLLYDKTFTAEQLEIDGNCVAHNIK